MKTIMISIRPQWVAKILNGEKTIEIRKKFPKDYVGWVYIYCTKNGEKPYDSLVWDNGGKGLVNSKYFPYAKDCPEHNRLINGKVVARFWCDKVEEIPVWKTYLYANKNTCLSKKEIEKYLEVSAIDFELDENYIVGKAIHITKLEIFDKPKELKNFMIYSHTVGGIGFKGEEKQFKILKPLNRAPQSWCYIEI